MNYNLDRRIVKTPIVIGIGGISRAGKSSLTKFLTTVLKPVEVFHMDRYLKAPLKKFDETLNQYVEDWEDPAAYDFDKFVSDLKEKIESLSKINADNIVIVEGFLLYSRKEFVDLLDIKIMLQVDKEVARERRIQTKYYIGDYYFDQYIWKVYNEEK